MANGCAKTDANAAGPHDVMKLLFVERGLRGELCKVDAGAELGRIDIDLERAEHALVFVDNIVARIAREVCSEAGQSNVLILQRGTSSGISMRVRSVLLKLYFTKKRFFFALSMNRWI